MQDSQIADNVSLARFRFDGFGYLSGEVLVKSLCTFFSEGHAARCLDAALKPDDLPFNVAKHSGRNVRLRNKSISEDGN